MAPSPTLSAPALRSSTRPWQEVHHDAEFHTAARSFRPDGASRIGRQTTLITTRITTASTTPNTANRLASTVIASMICQSLYFVFASRIPELTGYRAVVSSRRHRSPIGFFREPTGEVSQVSAADIGVDSQYSEVQNEQGAREATTGM